MCIKMADNELDQNAVVENNNDDDNNSSCNVSENISEESGSENSDDYVSSNDDTEYESLEDFCDCNSCSILRENQKQVLLLNDLSKRVSKIETQFCEYITLSNFKFVLNTTFIISALAIALRL